MPILVYILCLIAIDPVLPLILCNPDPPCTSSIDMTLGLAEVIPEHSEIMDHTSHLVDSA